VVSFLSMGVKMNQALNVQTAEIAGHFKWENFEVKLEKITDSEVKFVITYVCDPFENPKNHAQTLRDEKVFVCNNEDSAYLSFQNQIHRCFNFFAFCNEL